ncbi:hypothetical protein JANAI62_22170 [Jannaschia pagri]|uniref:Uncharacterized protein n=2 Tax=Roseobacteraceae TaxID=2854170 RepID=A0ABQ4NMX9_9RHOB|nr:hypothetical protein JANAI61_22180 [Jannaschia sp. AI_61]GIT95594.1 hypothetical protein JANAI62_22170 [Jannaschia sp. AI_62]
MLAACNTVAGSSSDDGDRILTDAFDGRYRVVVNRLRNGLEPDGSTPSLRRLATLTLGTQRGEMSLLAVDDLTAGENYTDFQGFFSVGGRLRMSMTAGFLTNSVGQSSLSVDEIVGNTLLRGETITVQPRGFGENYTPVMTIRFLG